MQEMLLGGWARAGFGGTSHRGALVDATPGCKQLHTSSCCGVPRKGYGGEVSQESRKGDPDGGAAVKTGDITNRLPVLLFPHPEKLRFYFSFKPFLQEGARRVHFLSMAAPPNAGCPHASLQPVTTLNNGAKWPGPRD